MVQTTFVLHQLDQWIVAKRSLHDAMPAKASSQKRAHAGAHRLCMLISILQEVRQALSL